MLVAFIADVISTLWISGVSFPEAKLSATAIVFV
jgi:hypothetical protein